MTEICPVRLSTVTRSRGKPLAPKPPVEYGAVLMEHRKALGLERGELAKLAGVDYNTVLRNETGMAERSVKGANAIRDALVKQGRDVPPVPVGEGAWSPPVVVPAGPKLDPADETVRHNLVRFREAIGLDQFAAAFAVGIPYDELHAYELGEQVPSNAVLAKFANAYGCNTGAFLDAVDELPKFDLERQVAFHFGGPATKYLTDAERETLARIAANVTQRDREAKVDRRPAKKRR